MKWTIGKRIIVGFTAIVIITGSLGIFALIQMYNVNRQVKALAEQALPGVKNAKEIDSSMQETLVAVLRHSIAKTPADATRFEEKVSELSKHITQAYQNYDATISQPEDRENFKRLSELRKPWLAARDKAMQLAKENKDEEARLVRVNEMYPAFERMDDQIAKMVVWNDELGAAAGKEALKSTGGASLGIMIGLGAAITVAAVIAFFIIRSVNNALRGIAASLSDGSTQVAEASSQVSQSSQSLAQGASEQAASLEETSSSLEEISSMTKKNADTAHQASVLSTEAKVVSDKGKNAMSKMGSAILDIQKSAAETAKIIKTIDEIAFQTNLLALNAAVEAARAGEAGKGFAVVAEEVRNLAMRSADAAKTTSTLIEGSVQNAKNGVAISEEVARSLDEITEATGKVNLLVSEIAAACQEQTLGVGQVNQAVQQMDKVTQSNAAAAEESAASAEELTSQSQQLRGVVNGLLVLVQGARSAAHSAAIEPARARPMLAKPGRKAPKHDPFPLGEPMADAKDFSDFNIAA